MDHSKMEPRPVSSYRGSAATKASEAAPELAFEKSTLENGLTVILLEEHRLPLVAVNLWYHVGPANEEPERTGFAHLFEHMMFQGSKHLGADSHIKILEAAGASEINGTTDFDRTNYFETLPSRELELALWLESDRMGYLLEKIDEANLQNQQDVVRNERRQSVENQPYGIVEEKMYHLLFPPSHPYYASVIGSHRDIQAARLEDVHAFFKQFYVPNNASLAIVGDIDKEETRALVQKYFGTLQPSARVAARAVVTPPLTAERRAVVPDRVELPRVYLAWLTPSVFGEGDAEADVAASVLAGGKSSRLYKRLVYERQIAQDVRAQQYSLQLSSVFTVVVTGRPGRTAEEIEHALDEELQRFREEGPGDEEVARATNTFETRILQGLESLGGFGGVADRLNLYNHYLGTPDYLARDLARYRAVSALSLKSFAATHLVPGARVVVHAVPGEPDLGVMVPTPPPSESRATGGASVNREETWRFTRPAPGRARPLELPVPSSVRLGNGLTLLWSERPGLPVVAANLVVRTGGGANPIARPGLASFTAAMLDEGTASRSALQIADDVAQLGASLATSAAMDASFVSVRALQRNFGRALEILADVVRRPYFPDEEIERQRRSRLTALAQQRDSAALVAGRAMSAALYGSAHPYGFPEIGTEPSIRGTRRADLAAFWSQNFVPNNAALVVTGSLTGEAIRDLAEGVFADWTPGAPAPTELPSPAGTKASIILIDKPGAPQTVVRVARLGAARSAPDYEAIEIMNTVLGGLFSSRINQNLRETYGYTYGAGSTFIFRRAPGPFYVGAAVRTDATAPAVREIFEEIRRMREEPATAEELERAKSSLVRSLPGDFETSASAAGSFSSLFIHGLPLDHYATTPERVMAVGAEAVQAAAEKYLVPEDLVVIAVGDCARIEPELRALGLGEVEIWDADANVRTGSLPRK